MANFGTLSVLDTLAAQRNTTVANYGEDKTFDAIMVAFAAHDRIMTDMLGDLVEYTNDQLRFSGAYSTMTAERLGEYGRPQPQKVTAGANLGFPLDRFGNALQWTRDWFRMKSPAELAVQAQAVMDADRQNVMAQIKAAVLRTANYTWVDWMTNNISIPVKRMANADSFPIPPAPDGSTFTASSHTHYLARVGALAASDVSAVISTVREHFADGDAFLYIPAASEAAVRAMANFTPYYDNRVQVASTVTYATGTLNTVNTYDRAIGLFDTAEVWVKPWLPANYMFAFIRLPGSGGKPLAFRTFPGTNGAGSLELVADIDEYPLRSQAWRREFGIGVSNRVAAASLYTGGTSWVDAV